MDTSSSTEFLISSKLPSFRFRPYDPYDPYSLKQQISSSSSSKPCFRPFNPLMDTLPLNPITMIPTTSLLFVNNPVLKESSDSSITTSISLTITHQTKTHISQLYPEILTMIFQHLPVRDKGRVAQVCSVWRDAVYRKSIWTGVEAKLHLRRAKPHVFNSLVKRGIRRVQVLSIRRTLRDVFTGIPNIESLNLSGIYSINDLMFTHGIRGEIPSLTTLDLSLCKQITDMTLEQIARYMRNLQVLELGGCSNISHNGLFLLSVYLKDLRVLNLRSCWHINDNGIANIAGHHDYSAPCVVHYNIYGNHLLESLTLQDCQHLSDEALRYISVGLKRLKKINLSFCVSISDRGLKYIAEMPELEELNLRSCDNISDRGIGHLSGSETGTASKLKLLDVSFCDKISDVALRYMSEGITQLISLSLSACPISDSGLQFIAKTLLKLETLNIGQCKQVTDQGVLAITNSLKQLTAIDLYGCVNITTVGLEVIMKLPRLKTLNLGLWIVR